MYHEYSSTPKNMQVPKNYENGIYQFDSLMHAMKKLYQKYSSGF